MTFKTSLIFFATLALIASCSSSLRGPTPLTDDKILQSIEQFFEGYFTFFDLPKPTELINCYSKLDVLLFFTNIIQFQSFLDDINDRKAISAHLRILELFLLAFPQAKASECVVKTQDYQDLLKALDINPADIKNFTYGESLYLQAHYSQLQENMGPVVDSVMAENYHSAGIANGFLMKSIVDTIKSEQFGYLYITAFSNGFAFGTGVPDPVDSLTVWNHTTGGVAMKFLFELASAVTEGSLTDAFDNSVKFWKEKGEDILGEIPLSVWECLEGSNDNKALTEKLGVNVLSKEYEDLAAQYIKKYQLQYYIAMNLIKYSVKNLDFIHAGAVYGYLTKTIAATKGPSSGVRMKPIQV